MKCDECGKESKKLQSWGLFMFCPKCVGHIKKEFPDKTQKKRSEIRLKPPRGRGGAYDPSTRSTLIYEAKEEDVLLIINHENIHFALHRLFGVRCCYQYDSVYEVVDPYHSFE